jgi:geranylgeranyl diphosphate synthase type I
VKTGYELVTKHYNKDIISVAAAIEIMHTAILIHDDIIDKSPLRRGKETLYKILGNDHFGVSQAISLGDAGFFLAIQILSQSRFPVDRKVLAIQQFVTSMKQTTQGEILDVALSSQKEEGRKKEKDVITIHSLKTAQYTFVSPFQIGAMLGGGKKEMLKNIKEFGENIGIAYQIKDDILGVFGEEDTVGKSVYSDIAEGKQTLLIQYAINNATVEQKKILKQHYGKTIEDVAIYKDIKKIFIATGALTYSEEKVLVYTNAAKRIIPNLIQTEKEKRLFTELIAYVIERNS